MVLAGMDANFFRLPAFPNILAPTAAPRIAERLGATVSISNSTCASNFLRKS